MKTRTSGRVVALVLAVLMLLPLISVPTFAEATEVDTGVSYDFENLTANSAITAGAESGFNASYSGDLPTFHKVLEEDGNKFIRLPIVYNSDAPKTAPTNMDKSLYPNHPAYTADDEYVVIESAFRPHGGVGTDYETVELQIRKFSYDVTVENGSTLGGVAVTENATYTNGQYYNLLHINLNTGELTNSWGLNKTGAAGMKQNEWNTLKYILNLKDASASVYVNGVLYGTIDSLTAQYSSGGWQYAVNPSNISFNANNIIISKINKRTGSFVKLAEAGAATYANGNYIDVDNIKIDSMTRAELDGNFEPEAYNGLLTSEAKASVRLTAPTGIRFATKVDTAKLDALYALLGDNLIDIELGTLIVPEDYLEAGTEFTFDALDAAGKDYVTVEATYGKYYDFDDDAATTHFVGSLVNIKDKNIDRNFVGKGYVKVTLVSGLEYVYYANGYVSNVQATAGKVISEGTDTSGWTEASKRVLEAYANNKSFEDMYKEVLTGLDVLALGDSLFSSSDATGTTRANQWVNAMGTKYGWNLTNLGYSGMTVSYTAGNTSSGKASMYDKLFNSNEPFQWNIADENFLYPATGNVNAYFQTGNFEGKTNEDVDLIIMEGGCNDYGTAVAAPLGEIGSTDGATFIGAYNAIVQKLMEMYPNAKVLFLTTWHLNNQTRPDNANSIEYSSAVTKLYEQVYADNDRVFHIDMGNPAVSNVDMRNAAFRAEYCVKPGDAYHLNDKGMARLQAQMTPMIWELWVNNCLPAAPKEWTIPEAVAAEDGTEVVVSGTVTLVNDGWNDNFGNMNVTISDDSGNKLYIYRLATQVALGDVITVTGKMGTYSGTRQIAQGATAVITGHVEIVPEYTEMTIPEVLAADDSTLVIVKGTVTEVETAWTGSYANVTISDDLGNKLYIYKLATEVVLGDVVIVTGAVGSYNGSKQIAAGATAEITGHVEIVIPEPAGVLLDFSQQGYANAQQISTVEGTNFTVTFDKGSNSNTPKYYTSGSAIRLYGGGTMTVTAAEGYTIKSITIKFGSGDGTNAITTDVGTFDGEVWTGDATTVVFTEGGTKGNRRFATVTVELEAIA